MPIVVNPLWKLTRSDIYVIIEANTLEERANKELRVFLERNPKLSALLDKRTPDDGLEGTG